MNVTKVKFTGRTPQFKEVVSWNSSGDGDNGFLLAYIQHVHPNADTIQEAGSFLVATSRGRYLYKIKRAGIMRTNTETGEKKMYKF
jgi:hypothetical protein